MFHTTEVVILYLTYTYTGLALGNSESRKRKRTGSQKLGVRIAKAKSVWKVRTQLHFSYSERFAQSIGSFLMSLLRCHGVWNIQCGMEVSFSSSVFSSPRFLSVRLPRGVWRSSFLHRVVFTMSLYAKKGAVAIWSYMGAAFAAGGSQANFRNSCSSGTLCPQSFGMSHVFLLPVSAN